MTTNWQDVADNVLAVMMVRNGAWVDAMDSGVTVEDFPPGKWRDVYAPLVELQARHKEQRALLHTEIVSAGGETVPGAWVLERIGSYDEWCETGFSASLEQLKKYGRAARCITIIDQTSAKLRAAMKNGVDIQTPLDDLVNELQIEQSPTSIQVTDIADIGAEVEAAFNAPPKPPIKTGIPIFDSWTGGLSEDEMVAWVGPTKQRKTSATAHAILTLARQGKQIDFFSFDEKRPRIYYRFMSMLMAEYMWRMKLWDMKAKDGSLLNNVSRKMLQQVGDRWKMWPAELQSARIYARDELEKLRGVLRVYDTKTCGRTPAAVRSMARLDANKFGRLDGVFVDHVQSFIGYASTYEQVQYGSEALQYLKEELDCIMWVLSQQNEAAIKGGDAGSWSANVKGGGGLGEKSDTVIVSNYMQGTVTDPNYLRINLRQGRDDASGSFGYVQIHPASGWITPRVLKVDDVLRVTNLQAEQDAAIGPRQ